MFRASFKYFRGLYYGMAFLLGMLVIGTFGYVIINDYTIIEGFYMTLITVSTVGYGEIQPLNDAGRLFTAALIMGSFGTFAYVATSIGGSLLSGRYRDFYRIAMLERKIEELSGHTIICGYGNNGEAAVQSLRDYGHEYVVIEKLDEKVDRLHDSKDILYINGDATDESNIIRAGIERAKAIITTLPSDADNVFVCLTARQLNANLTIISRATNPKSESKLRLAGADNVILPDRVGGSHMASLVTTPDINEFLDKLGIHNTHEVNLEEVIFNLPSQSKTVAEVGQMLEGCVRVLGIKEEAGDYLVNPLPEQNINKEAKLFVLGTRGDITQLRKLLSVQ